MFKTARITIAVLAVIVSLLLVSVSRVFGY